MAITSITHALNTPPRVTGRTLDPWSDLSGFANDIKKHFDHIGFGKYMRYTFVKHLVFELFSLLENNFQIPDK